MRDPGNEVCTGQNKIPLHCNEPRRGHTLDSPLNNPVLRLKAMTRLGPRVNSITSVAGGISCTSAFVWRRSHESEQPGSQISSATQAKQTLVIYFTSQDFILSSETGTVMDSCLTLSNTLDFICLFVYLLRRRIEKVRTPDDDEWLCCLFQFRST